MNGKNVVSAKNRFYILDLLRFLAAVAVVFYHYSVYFDESSQLLVALSKYGYLGVDFFFLLSGFVIMASAQNRKPLDFMFARALRIYPAFIVCLFLTVGISYWIGGVQIPLKSILLNATILNDYLGVQNIDGVYWTLQAELKFYGCIFILLLSGLFIHFRYWILVWLFVAILHHFIHQPFFMGWFINPSYSFYFISGVCAFLISKNNSDWLLKLCFFISMLFGIIVAGEQVNNFVTLPDKNFIFNVRIIVTMFFLFFYALANGLFNVKVPPKWWMYAGAISYPLYLLHNRAGKALIERYFGDLNIYVLVSLVGLLIALIALMVHLFVERPLQLIKIKQIS
jgi:peptidoglycan/LPS O-acetylase OafA/YrhL